MRVLWLSVDELRETLEHAMRNPPELDQVPPQSQPVFDLDLTAEAFVERLDALPAQIVARLRQ